MKRSKKGIIGVVVLMLVLLIGAGVWLLITTAPGGSSGTQTGDKHVHSYGNAETFQPATCAQDGIEVSKCVCGMELLSVTKATGHTVGEWTVEVDATCLETGLMSAVCETCNQKETKTIPCTKHNYGIVAADETQTTEGTKYVCAICADEFTLTATDGADVLTERYISDCDTNFSFNVYCEQDATYIYEHLRIVDAYFIHSENEVEIAYNAQSGSGNWWTITPVEPYMPGDMYVAARSGAVFFEDYAVQDLTFSIKREESKVMELSEDVIFLQILENEDPGYYPYTLDYSEETNTYWLSLRKLGDLAKGDTICVGNAQSLEDILNQDEEPDIFGKIQRIEYSQESGNYLIMLESPDLTEMFSALDVYSSDMMPMDGIDMQTPEQLSAQAKQILYQSEEFAKFICAAQSTSDSYLSARGLNTNLASFKDFFSQIKISDDGTVYPTLTEDGVITGKIVLNGSITIPVTLSKDPDGQQIGEIKIYFDTFVEINSLVVILDIHSHEVKIEDAKQIVKMQVGTQQQVTTGFTFGVELNLDWSLGAKPYVLNTKSGTYHIKSCKHVAAVKDDSQLEKLSAEDLFIRIAEETVDATKECKTCLPISSMMADHYVLNTESKIVHLPNCFHLKQAKRAPLEVSELPFGNILAMDYTECADCTPSSRYTNSFSEQILNKMKYEDMGDSLAQFKELAGALPNGENPKQLQIAKIPFTITGLDVIQLQLSVYFDFHLEAAMEYNYTLQVNSQYGIYLTQKGFQKYADSSTVQKENSVSITGKMRVDVGIIAGINLHIKGVEKYCFVELNAKVGLYAKIQGSLRHDFLNIDDSYAAAYFEAGVHCDLIGSARLATWETLNHSFIKEDMRDIPILNYGYEKVYYNFDWIPDILQIDTIYYNLEEANLLRVKYFDVIQMKEGVDTLSISGISGKYTVDFNLQNGTNCVISSGYLLVNTPEVAFEDVLTITVNGSDQWGKYRRGNTKYDVGSYSVRIVYDPLKNTVEIPSDAVEYADHYYRLYRLDGTTSYEEAKAYCESVGGYPCTITSAEEGTFIANYLMNNGAYSQIAFGLTYDAEQTAWVWANGEQLNYMDWIGECPAGPATAALSVFDLDYSWDVGDFSYAQQEGILILCEWGAYEDTGDMTVEERLEAIVGYYEGWYTAIQGITGGTLGIHRTNALLADEYALQLYADWATDCSRNSEGVPTKIYTIADIVSVLEKHTEEYVAVFMFGPLRQNPDVEDGVYTMTIAYDETKNTYILKGSAWIQRDTYIFVDLLNVILSGDNLLGDVYGDYVELFWTKYGDVGDLSLVRFDPMQDP